MQKNKNAIGTLNEHPLHAALKRLIEPDLSKHEQKVDGYIVDILSSGTIAEIETRSFARLQKKLPVLLSLYPVTVVFPLITAKWIIRIDAETGEISQKRKSPKKSRPVDIFPQLYRILPHLTDSNLSLSLHPVEVLSYQTVCQKDRRGKRRKLKEEIVPLSFGKPIEIHSPKDYLSLISFPQESPFTADQFAKYNTLSRRSCWYTLRVLQSTDFIRMAGKRGRAFLYEKL